MLGGGGCEASLPGISFHKSVMKREDLCGKASLRDVGILTNPESKSCIGVNNNVDSDADPHKSISTGHIRTENTDARTK